VTGSSHWDVSVTVGVATVIYCPAYMYDVWLTGGIQGHTNVDQGD